MGADRTRERSSFVSPLTPWRPASGVIRPSAPGPRLARYTAGGSVFFFSKDSTCVSSRACTLCTHSPLDLVHGVSPLFKKDHLISFGRWVSKPRFALPD